MNGELSYIADALVEHLLQDDLWKEYSVWADDSTDLHVECKRCDCDLADVANGGTIADVLRQVIRHDLEVHS